MDISTLLLIILVPLGIYLFINQNKQQNIKSAAVKKSEIIEDYKSQMKAVLIEYENDSEKQKEEKIKLLKKINSELSMNLFFDEQEAKEILNDLLKIK